MTRNFTTMGRRPVALRTILFWNMVLIALVTVTAVGSLLHFSLVRALRQGAENEQALLARQVSREFDSSLMHAVNLLQAIASEPSLLTTVCEALPEVRQAYAAGPEGTITAFASRTRRRPPVAPSGAVALAARYFQGGGRFYIAAGRGAGGRDQVVLVAVPQVAGGRTVGTLVAEFPGDALADSLISHLGDPRIDVYLAGEDGRFLGARTPPGWRWLPAQLRDRAARAPVGETMAAIAGDSLVTVLRAPWTGWPIVVREATDVALNPIYLARWAFFVLTPLALMIATLLSVRQAAWIAGDETRRIERLAVAVVEAQENERRRIAQDIHDWTAQRITSSYYHVQLLERLLAKDPALVAKELPQLAATLDSANTELREIMRNLHPHLLNEVGLATAVKELATDFARGAGLEYEVEVPDGAPEPPRHVGIALFRILQEALSNVGKHASARRVHVALRLALDRATLAVRDDGTGFDSEAAPAPNRTGGLGLAGMRERAELLGGAFFLFTTPGRGTTIEVSIPWNRESNHPSTS